ncbi:APC family permease [Porticoccus sp. W117]|uniref:APC family permease n=1 Tax=Porticoccus sp. W117 TaxID=3054777 RepID=UPI0025950F25|nr:APC family permease [Porticoccus sp. W117]MDM3871034.1 APC family permease [Porticoccus sp. W117]
MTNAQSLPRSVGFWGTTLFSVNGMIGSGIFALPAILVAAVGSFAPWMMLLGAVLILPLTIILATLAARFDAHGGPVLYTQAAFGSFVGFQTGWSRYASGVVAVAANTQVAVAYLAVLFPVLEDPLINVSAVIGFIAFTTIVNIVGMRTSVGTLGVMTVIKLAPIVILVLVGLVTRDPAIGFHLPEFTEVESVILLTFYAYMAFENATFPAGEVRNPKRNIPLVLITSLFAVALFYMLVIWTYLAIAPEVSGNESALAAAAGELFGQTGVVIISVAAAFSIGANTLSGGTVTPRLTYGMAEQGTLPKVFAYVSSRFQSPYFSILFYGAAAILFSLWGGFVVLALASTLSRIVMYLLTAFALPVLQRKNNEKTSWWHLLMVLLAAASTIWVASHASGEAYQMLGFILAVGTGLYFLAVRKNLHEPGK